MHGVQDDPAYRTLRGTLNAEATLLAGFTTVRNLGLMVRTGGYLLDVALQRSIDNGWHVGPRIIPAGHAVTPYGGHLDPTVFQRMAPGIMPLSVGEGRANGVAEVRECVRYQLRHGAKVIKDKGGVREHRILAQKDALMSAAIVIVIAGMDGALSSVVGGLVRVPVIAVPTSVGYGAAFEGLAPLLTMLNSCAAGVTVVNIDNGFGAAAAASRINHA